MLKRTRVAGGLCAFLLGGGAYAADLEWDAKNRRITFESESPVFSGVELKGQQMLRISAQGLSYNAEIGAPDVPTISKLIVVPAGTKPFASVVVREVTDLPSNAQLAYNAEDCRHCNFCSTADGPDQGAYAALLGQNPVTFEEVSYAGSVPVSLMTIHPVRVLKDGHLQYIQDMDIDLRFVPDEAAKEAIAPVGAMGADDHDFYSRLVFNPEDLPAATKKADGGKDLIIAHREFEEALAPLIAFKQSIGRQVDVRYFDNPSRSDVSSLIEEQYATSEPPTHVLLVGSIDHIPSHWSGQFWSDYPYSLLDSGNYPDLSIGRIAARNPAELTNQAAKIIARETTPRNDTQILMTSGFETSWCQVNLQFIIDNIYSGARTPLNVSKLYASDGFRTDAVIEGYNQNPNIIVYDGHGDPSGMTEIPLKTSHLDRLANDSYPLIMDIACNNANWGRSGTGRYNFAESIAALEETGAAGIMASTYFSGGHDLFRHLFRAAIYDDQSPRDPFHEINEIGSMIHYAKIKYLEQKGANKSALEDNKMFFWLGDPASTFFEQGEL